MCESLALQKGLGLEARETTPAGQGKETTGYVLGKVLRVLLRRLLVGGRAVTGSDSDALSEPESESDESARQEKALGLAKREVTVGDKVLSVSGRVRVGLVVSCLWISACLALSVRTTDGKEEKKDTVARGIDQGTEGLRDRGEEHRIDEGGGVWLAARARTRLGLSPSDLRLGKAGEACMLVSSQGCEARALTLGVRLRDTGGEVLEDSGEGMNENGGGRLKLTGGPTFGLPPVPKCVVATRSDAGYVSSSAIITRHCGLSWELFHPCSPQ